MEEVEAMVMELSESMGTIMKERRMNGMFSVRDEIRADGQVITPSPTSCRCRHIFILRYRSSQSLEAC